MVECIRSHLGGSPGDSTRACARALGQVSGRMYQESHGEVGWRQHARMRASFEAGEWSNVSGVTWRRYLATARAHACTYMYTYTYRYTSAFMYTYMRSQLFQVYSRLQLLALKLLEAPLSIADKFARSASRRCSQQSSVKRDGAHAAATILNTSAMISMYTYKSMASLVHEIRGQRVT